MRKWTIAPIFTVLVLTLVLSFPFTEKVRMENPSEEGCPTTNYIESSIPHVNITCDSDLASQGWAGNGTESDPYVIADMNILADGDCILIANTSLFLVIQDSTFFSERESWYTGIRLTNVSNCRIENCGIDRFHTGIFIESTRNCSIINNDVHGNQYGVQLYSSIFCFIQQSTITNNEYSGIRLRNSSHVSISDTLFLSNHGGIKLVETISCEITNNTFLDDGISIEGNEVSMWDHLIHDNTVNGRPLGYFFGNDSTSIEMDQFGQVILADCEDCTLTGGNIYNTSIGILIGVSKDCQIAGNAIHSCSGGGIEVRNSTECLLKDNSVTTSSSGIRLLDSSQCSIVANILDSNYNGIGIFDSSSCTIANNTSTRNEASGFWGFDLVECSMIGNWICENALVGFELFDSQFCSIVFNTICDSKIGIWLISNNCTLTNNTVHRHEVYGIVLNSGASGNWIFGNSIGWNGESNAVDDGLSNHWDDNVSIGNAWGDYLGFGVYLIPGDAGSVDRYPRLPPEISTSWTLGWLIVIIVVTAILILLMKGYFDVTEIISTSFIIYILSGILYLLAFLGIKLLPVNAFVLTLVIWDLHVSKVFLSEEGSKAYDLAAALFGVITYTAASLLVAESEEVITQLTASLGPFAIASILAFILAPFIILITARVTKSSREGVISANITSMIQRVYKLSPESAEVRYSEYKSKSGRVGQYLASIIPIWFIAQLGAVIGTYAIVLDSAGLLSIGLAGTTLVKETYVRYSGTEVTIPLGEKHVTTGFSIVNLKYLVWEIIALAACGGSLTVLMRRVPSFIYVLSFLEEFLWITNYVLLFIVLILHISQMRSRDDYDRFNQSGSSLSVVSIGLMFLLTLFWNNVTSSALGSIPAFIAWVVLAAITVRDILRKELAPESHFFLRGSVLSLGAYAYILSISVGYLTTSKIVQAIVGALAIVLFLFMADLEYPLNLMALWLAYGLALMLLWSAVVDPLTYLGLEVFWLVVIGFGSMLIPSLYWSYQNTWKKFKGNYMATKDEAELMKQLASEKKSLEDLVKDLGLTKDEVDEMLKILFGERIIRKSLESGVDHYVVRSKWRRRQILEK